MILILILNLQNVHGRRHRGAGGSRKGAREAKRGYNFCRLLVSWSPGLLVSWTRKGVGEKKHGWSIEFLS